MEDSLEKLQQRITRLHPPGDLCDRRTTVPGLLAFEQHSSVSQIEAAFAQATPQIILLAAINDVQVSLQTPNET